VRWDSLRWTAGLLLAVLALGLGGCGGLLHGAAVVFPPSELGEGEPATSDRVRAVVGHQSPTDLTAAASSDAGSPAVPVRAVTPGSSGRHVTSPIPAEPVGPTSRPEEERAGGGRSAAGERTSNEEPAVGGGPWSVHDATFALDLDRELDVSLSLFFEPIRDETLVKVMLGLREWPTMLAQAPPAGPSEDEAVEYDPWEPFNEPMFEFNRKLDRWVLKPVAQVWDKIVPDELKQMIARGFDNMRTAHRIVNSLLQARWAKAGTETGRFLINSTLGFGGLWDIARQEFGIERPDGEDFGQTLGVWGVGPGPYLVLPVLPPATVRDLIGRVVDGFMNPVSYFTPFVGSLGLFVGDTINDRALNLELFQGFEETTLELYTAVRNAYLSRRARQLLE
jgi:phospholipid-binding lipoprotein MlaA